MSADTVDSSVQSWPQVSPANTDPHSSLPSSESASAKITNLDASSTPDASRNGVSANQGHDVPPKTAPQRMVNVWHLREEQMARKKAAAATASLPPQSSTSSGQPINNLPDHVVAPLHLSGTQNGRYEDSAQDDDPFVVRPGRSALFQSESIRLESSRATVFASVSMPERPTKDDWPEVGRSSRERNQGVSPGGEQANTAEFQRRTARNQRSGLITSQARTDAFPPSHRTAPVVNTRATADPRQDSNRSLIKPSSTHSGLPPARPSPNTPSTSILQSVAPTIPSSVSHSGILPPTLTPITQSQSHSGIPPQKSFHLKFKASTHSQSDAGPNSETVHATAPSLTPSTSSSQAQSTSSQAPSTIESAPSPTHSQPHSQVQSNRHSQVSSLAPSTTHSGVNSRAHSPYNLHSSSPNREPRPLPMGEGPEPSISSNSVGLTFGFVALDDPSPRQPGDESAEQSSVSYPAPDVQSLPYVYQHDPRSQHYPQTLPSQQYTAFDVLHAPSTLNVSVSAAPLPPQSFGVLPQPGYEWDPRHGDWAYWDAMRHPQDPAVSSHSPQPTSIPVDQAIPSSEESKEKPVVIFGNVGHEDQESSPAADAEHTQGPAPKRFPVFSIGRKVDSRHGISDSRGGSVKDKVSGGRIGNREVIDLTDGCLGIAQMTWKFGTTDLEGETEPPQEGARVIDESREGVEEIQDLSGDQIVSSQPDDRSRSDVLLVEQTNGLGDATSGLGAQSGNVTPHYPPYEWPDAQNLGYGYYGDRRRERERRGWELREDDRYLREHDETERHQKDEREERESRDRPAFHSQGGRPRRGSAYGSGFNNGRRSRGGFGRGYRFGRGAGGSGSGMSGAGGGYPRPSSFMVTPPPHFQPLQDPSPTVYYAPPPVPPPLQYLSAITGYEAYHTVPPHSQLPVPAPVSNVQFPLDPIRWQLLGQLEYYLSPQNMASDFFLRQRMDSCGWIPISLIASFNRVRQLSVDEQLVRDVLTLSNVVEVMHDSVRMVGWERFVLPDAPRSTVENGSTEMDAEDEDEEDVVFVMGREAGWMPDTQLS